ncbi:MAG: ral secretion pathway protein [Dehalococcoidales bacterium]|nr:ral secretion pathway protein [Dehalococcoidales bacterium]
MTTDALKVEAGPDLRPRVKEYLERQGYQVSLGVKLSGKSGIEHTFDMLAKRDDSFSSYTMAIDFIPGSNKVKEANAIFNLANKTFDAGIHDKVVIAVPGLTMEAMELAEKQRIKLICADRIGALLEAKVKGRQPNAPFRFETKSQLAESLTSLGYVVEEGAKVQGRSGTDYTFDITAYDFTGHSWGIDFLSGEKAITLEQVSVFDTKAYDVGIDDKVIVVSPGLSPEAQRFVQLQRIKVLALGTKPANEPVATKKEPAPVAEPTVKTEPITEKARAKQLRQMVQPEALKLIPEVMARRYSVIPLSITQNTLQVAMSNPADIFAMEALAAKTKMRIRPVTSSAKEVREAIDFNYKAYGEIEKRISLISTTTDITDDKLAVSAATDAPLAQALDLIIEEGAKARASDIHIEPEEDRLRIRYRIDSILHDMMSLPINVHRALISRLKILADMNIADHLRPLDGQFSTSTKGRQIDIRVATVPTVYGEMAVLRLLDKSMAVRSLAEIGFLPDILKKYEALLKTPYGMILVSGPTGSGKTTTLYASINSLDTLQSNVITIEDPAEYRFKDINQIQVNAQAGLTFAAGLRSILRLDPNVILVGEIRDGETASIAAQAALTGHLVLSSVHANDAATTLSRLIDLGLESFLVASAVIGVVAQRMVRRICPDCSRSMDAPAGERVAYEKVMGEQRTQFLYGTGCETCSNTGYRGRMGIFEILTMSDPIRGMLLNRTSSSEIRAQAIKEGMIPLMKDGMSKVKAGITTPAEVLRTAYSAD